MPHPHDIPLNCPTCGRPFSVTIQLPVEFQPRQTPSLKRIGCPYDGCDGHIDPTIHGEIVSVWTGHGPNSDRLPATLDSDLTTVNSVFREMDRAIKFLRMAEAYPYGQQRHKARAFAKSALDIGTRFLGRGRVSDRDGQRLTEELAALRTALDEFSE